MVFMCQQDSYLKTYSSDVVSCESAETTVTDDKGKNTNIKGFFIELKDTILFPEGGGQPSDFGTINGIAVKKVIRKGAKALHFISEEIAVGETVNLSVDWKRRFDHMQQHSAQHLITAIADDKFGFKTTSWDLGKSVSFIELDAPAITLEQMDTIEKLVNGAIRDHVPVEVHVTKVGSSLLNGVRTRGLPDDHVGDVRIVEMKGIEANMCCGTHVTNLAHLQIIKLLSIEKGKKGKTNINFLAGNRVLDYAKKSFTNEKLLVKHLKCGPDEHAAMVEKSVTQLKSAQKANTSLLRKLALLEAEKIKNTSDPKKLVSFHLKEGNVEYMNIIANAVGAELCLFMTVGDDKGKGMFLLSGPSSFISQCGSSVAETIEGRGSAKDTRMQGKADKLQRREQAIKMCNDYITSL